MKLNLDIDYDLNWIAKSNNFDPGSWFYLKSSYDGFAQIWILKRNGSSSYSVPLILNERDIPGSKDIAWSSSYNTEYTFKSLSDANAQIPGTSYPLFEGIDLPPSPSMEISKLRRFYYSEFRESTWNPPYIWREHSFLTHTFYNSEADSFFSFDTSAVLDDARTYCNLSKNELNWIKECEMYRHLHQEFLICIDSDHLTGEYSRKNKRILNKLLLMNSV